MLFRSMDEHIHKGVMMVGFYFLETPEGSSKAVFHDPRPGKVMMGLPEKDMSQATYASDMINFSVELETDSWNIVLNTEFTPKSAYWKTPFNETSNFENSFLWSLDYTTRCFLNRLYHRFNTTWELWTKGYITYSQSTVMNEQQALNYAATINQSIEDLRTFRNNLDIKRKENIDTDAEDGC